jgi:hypothetical protein
MKSVTCSFHLDTVTLRLTQLASGQWQHGFGHGVPAGGAKMVAECLSDTLGTERRRLLPVFQDMLTTTSTLVPDEEHRALSQSEDAWEVVLLSCKVWALHLTLHFVLHAIIVSVTSAENPADCRVLFRASCCQYVEWDSTAACSGAKLGNC